MTSREYRRLIAALGLSQVRAAKLVGVMARTSRRWASGQQDITEPAARLLRLVEICGLTGAEAMDLLDVPKNNVLRTQEAEVEGGG